MTLNLQAKDSYHVFDEYGMLCVPSDQSWGKRSWWKKLWDWILKREWIPTWSNKSWMDSLGRMVLAWIAYERPKELDNAIDDCLSFNFKKNRWDSIRHPKHKEKSSRDHWSYQIIFYKLSEGVNDWFKKDFIPYVPRMRGMNLWMKNLTGNKLAEFFYYLIYIPGALIGNIWLRICRWAGRIGPERDNNWWIEYNTMRWVEIMNASNMSDFIHNGWNLQRNRTKWQKFWGRIISISIPAYALHNKAWQIYVMPESQSKAKLKRILLQRVGKSNIMLRLLFEPNVIYNADYLKGSYKLVTQQEVDNYPHMTGYRPGVYLDETCRRTIRELTAQEAEFNTYEKDLIIWLFKQHKKEIFKRICECTSKISNLTKGTLMFADAIVDTNKVFLKFKEAVSLLKRT